MPLSTERCRPTSGFTLVELLVTVVIGAAVTLGLTTLLTAELRSNTSTLRFQRLRQQASHARRFIESEAFTASRLQGVSSNSLSLFGIVPGTTNAYTITYQVVSAQDVSQPGVQFRGPFVLVRQGPPYNSAGVLASNLNQSSVILDGLESATAFRVQAGDSSQEAEGGSSLGASVVIDIATADASYNPQFFIAVATNPAFGVLQRPTADFVANCGNPVIAGCRNTSTTNPVKTTQEWDTRTLADANPITITPVGSPTEVIVYFNVNKPTTTNAIRRTSSITSPVAPCIRSSCYVAADRNYQINTRVDRLVFLDTVVGVPAN